MHVFGSLCYAYVQNAKKLEPRSNKRSPAYLVYYPESRRVERVRCVKFFDSGSSVLPVVEQSPNMSEVETATRTPPEIDEGTARYPTRARNKPTYLGEYVVKVLLTIL